MTCQKIQHKWLLIYLHCTCSLGYFRFYVIMSFIFLILASVLGTLWPIWEARDLFAKVLTGNTFQELIERSFHGSRAGSRCAASYAGVHTHIMIMFVSRVQFLGLLFKV
jgi:hypothetical protein